MISKKLIAVALVAGASTAFAGGEVDFALSDVSVRIEHDAVLVGTGAHFSTGILYSEENSNWAITAGFNAVDATMANKEVIGGVGFKAMVFKTVVEDLSTSLGVGGFVRWHPQMLNGLGFEAQGYYSPSILSFGSLDEAYEGVARLTYKVLPQARVFLGYHAIGGMYDMPVGEDQHGSVDSRFHLGFRMSY